MIDPSYWLELAISPRAFNEIPDSWLREFKKRVFECYDEDQVLIENFFKRKIDKRNTDILKDLLESDEGKAFYGLVHYLVGKVESLEDFFKIIELNYNKSTLLKLIYLYINFPEKIVDHAYYNLFNKTRMLEKWIANKEIKIQDLVIFESPYKLSNYTRKFRLGKNLLAKKFILGESSFFCFERAKKESVAMGYQEKKSLRKRAIYFIKINKNNVEIRSGDPRIPDFFDEILQDLGYEIYSEQVDINDKSLSDIIKSVIEFDLENPKITSLDFVGMEQGVNCKVLLEENNSNHPLSESIKVFQSNNILDTENINKLKSFEIEFDGVSQKIILNRSDPENITFELTNKGINERKYEQIISVLKKVIE